jgi:hypothetical protein
MQITKKELQQLYEKSLDIKKEQLQKRIQMEINSITTTIMQMNEFGHKKYCHYLFVNDFGDEGVEKLIEQIKSIFIDSSVERQNETVEETIYDKIYNRSLEKRMKIYISWE